jgi:anti-anti-sigma regulatory factor
MARNFRISSLERNNRQVRISLQGDFDGTAAHELIHTLRKYLVSYPQVAIDTDGLKRIHAFGLDVFSVRMKLLGAPNAGIVFSGKFRSTFDRR